MVNFFVIAFGLLSVAIYAVYLLLSVFFSVTKMGGFIILASLILISVGFILAMFMSRAYEGEVVRIIYLIFSLAIGLLFYLTISGAILQILVLINLNISHLILARIGVGVAIILFVIGLFNAGFPRVKNISVIMAGLPVNWQGKQIVQLSDIHLGGIYGLGFLDRQIARANALKPDLIVITGDLFDDSEKNISGIGAELAKLKAKEGVIFIPGNHDVMLGLDKIAPVLAQANITMLRDQAVTISGLEIIGLDLHQLTKDDNPQNISGLMPYTGQARLLLKHVPLDIAWAKDNHVGLQLSGHSHNGQMFPLQLLTYLFYGKYQYGLHTEGTYNIYTSSGLGSWGPPVRTFNPAEIVNITIN